MLMKRVEGLRVCRVDLVKVWRVERMMEKV